MNSIRKNQNGMTMIMLVVTIIALGMIAGVTLKQVWGRDGILSEAQSATFVQSRNMLEEYLNSYYAENSEKFIEAESKAEALQQNTESSDWIYNPSKYGFSSEKYVVNSDGDILYLINKEALPERLRKQVKGGDAGGNNYDFYVEMKDVYGVTKDLKVYYCSTGKDSIMGITVDQLDKSE